MSVEVYDQDRDTETVETVEALEGTGRPVDPPDLPRIVRTVGTGAKAAVRRQLGTAAGQLARAPRYGLRIVRWAPVGAWRVLAAVARWVADVDGRADRGELARDNLDAWRRVREDHHAHVKHRLYGTGAVLLVLAAAGLVGWQVAPWWARAAVMGAVLLTLARVGRPADRPIVEHVHHPPAYRKLTADLVRTGLLATGYGKAPGDFTFPREISRSGAGYVATVDLPHGVTAGMVADRRDRIAGALRLTLDQVWVRVGRHAGQIELYVADAPVSATPQPRWPLARAGRADVFAPVQVGTDERGDPVTVTLAYSNLVIGAIPRMGKTAALRLVLLAGALDPRVKLWAADLKGTGDLSPLAPVCERYFVGDDDDTMAALMSSLRELHDDMRRRTSVVRTLPRDLAPDSKVTARVADTAGLDLSPVLLAVDECQVLFTDTDHSDTAERLITDLVKRGPAVGIIVVLATQRPDAKSLPTGITANAGMRLALRVMGQPENDAILGTGAYRNGVRATQLPASAKGLGWLVGAQDEPMVVRVHYVDGPAADRVVARAVQLRGGPVEHQHQAEVDRVDLVADVAAVWPADQDAAWSEVLVPRLAELRPDHYGDLTVPVLNARLRARGVRVDQVHRKVDGRGVTRVGVRRSAIDRSSDSALTSR